MDMMNNIEAGLMFDMANEAMIEQVKEGKLSLDNKQEKDLLISWLRANLTKSPKILSVLEAWTIILYEDNMEREYVTQFINRIREMGNSTVDEW